jgi:oxygen-independent coproporphyrinogen-3 oxidase
VSLLAELSSDPYRGYSYGYPHKTAYRALAPRPRLSQVWANEPTDALTLYVHVPFCEMRCGFCNLFTLRGGSQGLETSYLDAVERQAEQVLAALPGARFRAVVLGGGTPTQLSAASLERLLRLLARLAPGHPPMAVETSPRTADTERLDLLSGARVSRISLGVQSFDEDETRALGRPQRLRWVRDAIERIRARRFSVLNLDLIYGGANQTTASFLGSVEAALEHEPEELYLYPLYVRPLTGLGKRSLLPRTDARRALYRSARERLLCAGYEQVSMRFFRRPGSSSVVDTCCQEDGTVGLGCGARSYTRGLHYSFEWAVAQPAISDVVRAYVDAPAEAFSVVRHGFALDASEQRRRYVLKTLLRVEGLPLRRYREFFGTSALSDLPELERLGDVGLAETSEDALRLTPAGLELSDAIGPYLYSRSVRDKMAAHELV